jgi:hypothetical protein
MENHIESLERYLTESPTQDESPTQEYYRGSDFDEHIEEILGAQLEEEQRMLEQHRAQSIQLELGNSQDKKEGLLTKVSTIDNRLTNTPPILRVDTKSLNKTNTSPVIRICGYTPSPKTVGRDSPRLPVIVGRSNFSSALKVGLVKPQIINPIPIEEQPRLFQPLQQNRCNIEAQVSERSKQMYRVAGFFKIPEKAERELQFNLSP